MACVEHGVVLVLELWQEPRFQFTLLFKRLALDVMGRCDVSGVRRILRISWDKARGLTERVVTRGASQRAHKCASDRR